MYIGGIFLIIVSNKLFKKMVQRPYFSKMLTIGKNQIIQHRKKITSFLDLAFKNHQLGRKDIGYSRNPQDWTYLCRSCHMIADGRIKNLKQYEGD